jgi:hypothetical protein
MIFSISIWESHWFITGLSYESRAAPLYISQIGGGTKTLIYDGSSTDGPSAIRCLIVLYAENYPFHFHVYALLYNLKATALPVIATTTTSLTSHHFATLRCRASRNYGRSISRWSCFNKFTSILIEYLLKIRSEFHIDNASRDNKSSRAYHLLAYQYACIQNYNFDYYLIDWVLKFSHINFTLLHQYLGLRSALPL